jgi:predicted transcriptional regulator
MFGLFGNSKKVNKLESETRKSFSEVRKDFEGVSKWIKHLNNSDKQLLDSLNELKRELSSIQDDLNGLKEAVAISNLAVENKQVFKKTAVLDKQEAVYDVVEPVQTPVQTGNFHDILNGLSSNERLIVFTLMNTELKLSYEDIARLLGKERATIRGQINAIKQKSEGLIQELTEPNGKKRLFVSEEVRNKLEKYAKVRVKNDKKYKKLPKESII